MHKIVVAGSLNMDLVVQATRLPQGGETIMGKAFSEIPGGKGANQAVAMARLGAEVAMIGRVGQDGFGQSLLTTLQKDGVDTTDVHETNDISTGVALITVQESGENSIIVVPGANGLLTVEDIAMSKALEGASMAVTQLETPLESVMAFLKQAKTKGIQTILNPAPAQALPESIWETVDLLTPNETELALMTGMPTDSIEAVELAAKTLLAKGVKAIVVTLGAEGALYLNQKGERHLEPAKRVQAVDTTAAGDSFTAGLAVKLTLGSTMPEAMVFATKVAALTVQTLGAQSSLPKLEAVEAFNA